MTSIDKICAINNIKIIETKGLSFTAWQILGTDFALDRVIEILDFDQIDYEKGQAPIGRYVTVREYYD